MIESKRGGIKNFPSSTNINPGHLLRFHLLDALNKKIALNKI